MHIILKGGGYSIGLRPLIGLPPRHHHWTDTNDLPRSPVPPSDGGLDKPPSPWKRFMSWLRYYAKWFCGGERGAHRYTRDAHARALER